VSGSAVASRTATIAGQLDENFARADHKHIIEVLITFFAEGIKDFTAAAAAPTLIQRAA